MKISVIITAFNVEKYLVKAVESFLEQDYQDKELLIIDDISTDGSHKIIQDYCQKFPQMIKWIKEKDSGISNARNIALKHVTGDVVGFLGADDFFHKNFFSEMVYYAKVADNFDVMHFNSYCVGTSVGFDLSVKTPVTKRNLIKHCPIGSGESFYYRKEVFEQVQFNEKNKYSMDYELNMALVSQKKPDGQKYSFYPVNISAVFNVHTGDNISSASSDKQRLETVVVQLKYAKGLKEKLRIYWSAKKKIFRNYQLFCEIKKNV
jgi:glycosyltransferase involved in cell wall biosynthesis